MSTDEVAARFRQRAARHFTVYPEDQAFESTEDGVRLLAVRSGNSIRVLVWKAGEASSPTPLFDSGPHL